jgi:hypothetical protein
MNAEPTHCWDTLLASTAWFFFHNKSMRAFDRCRLSRQSTSLGLLLSTAAGSGGWLPSSAVMCSVVVVLCVSNQIPPREDYDCLMK